MGSYSQLPEDVAEKIAIEHLDTLSQHIVFSGVCKSWRSAALRGRRRCRRCLSSFPVLLRISEITTPSQSPMEPYIIGGQRHDFFTLATLSSPNSTSSWTPPITLPFFPSAAITRHRGLAAAAATMEDSSSYRYASTAHSFGSKDGWILRTLPGHRIGEPSHLYLLNPISGAAVPLPPFLPDFPLECIKKAIISSSPDNHEEDGGGCYVFILHRYNPYRLAWYNVFGGGRNWKFIENRSVLGRLQDATYFGGKLYVLGGHIENYHYYLDRVSVIYYNGDTMMIGPSINGPTFTFIDNLGQQPWTDIYGYHLCEINDQLHVVVNKHYHYDSASVITSFKVYKLAVVPPNNDDQGCHWVRVWSLDGFAIFIGDHQSFSIRASPSSFRADAIYFAFNSPSGCKPSCFFEYWNGVFHLPSQKLERFAVRDHNNHWMSPSSFWYLPMLGDVTKLQKKCEDMEEVSNDSDSKMVKRRRTS